jgi:uncharacterized protein (TIGR00297 family)
MTMAFTLDAMLALVAALAAYAARALSRSGAVAAFVIGTIVLGSGGWKAALVLLAFFIPSTVLSRVGRRKKQSLIDVGKTGPRDWMQVVANGGVAAVAMLLVRNDADVMLAAFAGAFAAASADTWGTEVGTLVRAQPRSVLTFARLPTGLSGGITPAGTVAEIAGAALVAGVAWALGLAIFVPVFAGGIAGAFADSLLGAGAQALRYCPTCRRDCETNPHACGTPTQLRRGIPWMGNDAVNLAATLVGALVSAGIFLL